MEIDVSKFPFMQRVITLHVEPRTNFIYRRFTDILAFSGFFSIWLLFFHVRARTHNLYLNTYHFASSV